MQKIDIKFKKIKCPKHDEVLELYVDESNLNFSIITWYCSHCDGFWYEDYFLDKLYRKNDYLDVSVLDYRFTLNCSNCNSNMIRHNCVPDCCNEHICKKCGTSFELEGTLIHKSNYILKEEESEDWMISQWGGAEGYKKRVTGYHRIEFKSELRQCPKHEKQLELYIADKDNYSERVIWVCSDCKLKYYENSFIKRPKYFVGVSQPGYLCEVCDNTDFDSISDKVGQCVNCKSIYTFELKPIKGNL
ncbi:MAG: hypothetical protein GY714_05450 [Desulfobacterales bacterium]|nr:hypothetical protein [Desulfobacterales bacterium]